MRASSRIIVNTLAQYVRTIFNMVLSLYSTRLILELLGLEDYGLFTLVAGVVSMLSFVTTALVSSTQRFLSVAQGKGDIQRVSHLFNNSVWLHIFFGLLFFIFFEALTPFLFNGFLNINPMRMEAAEYVYQQVIMMVLISFLASPYRALLVSHENIVYISIIDMIDGILKVVLVIGLVYLPIDKLVGYGWIMFILRLANCLAYLIYDTIKYEECVIPKFRNIDVQYLRELTSFTGWTIYSAGCVISRTQGLAVVLNKVMGTVVNAAYGIGLQISGYVSFVSSSLSSAINPQLMKAEGEFNREKMLYLAKVQSKLGYLLLAVVSIPSMFEIQRLLTLWLKEVPEHASLFCIMSLCGALIDTMTMGLVEANKAVGNIRKFMLWIATPKLLVLPVSWILLKLNCGIIFVVLTYISIETFTMLIRLPLLKESAGLDTMDFCKGVFAKIFVPTLASVIVCTLSVSLFDSSWRIIFTYSISAIVFLVCAYMTSLENNEKSLILRMVKKIK